MAILCCVYHVRHPPIKQLKRGVLPDDMDLPVVVNVKVNLYASTRHEACFFCFIVVKVYHGFCVQSLATAK